MTLTLVYLLLYNSSSICKQRGGAKDTTPSQSPHHTVRLRLSCDSHVNFLTLVWLCVRDSHTLKCQVSNETREEEVSEFYNVFNFPLQLLQTFVFLCICCTWSVKLMNRCQQHCQNKVVYLLLFHFLLSGGVTSWSAKRKTYFFTDSCRKQNSLKK